jgi:hypothetical protein
MRGGEVISIEEIDSLPPEKAARLYQLLAETGAAGVPPVSGATTLVPKSLKEA